MLVHEGCRRRKAELQRPCKCGHRWHVPYPFSFLTLIVSLEAIILSLFVLISQNRMSREADRRAHRDLQVNLLAEQENTKALEMLHRIAQQLGLEIPREDEVHGLIEKTDIDRLASELDERLPKDQ